MKTKNNKIKEFDTVTTFRQIKEKISKDIKEMSFEEFKKYLSENNARPKH